MRNTLLCRGRNVFTPTAFGCHQSLFKSDRKHHAQLALLRWVEKHDGKSIFQIFSTAHRIPNPGFQQLDGEPSRIPASVLALDGFVFETRRSIVATNYIELAVDDVTCG